MRKKFFIFFIGMFVFLTPLSIEASLTCTTISVDGSILRIDCKENGNNIRPGDMVGLRTKSKKIIKNSLLTDKTITRCETKSVNNGILTLNCKNINREIIPGKSCKIKYRPTSPIRVTEFNKNKTTPYRCSWLNNELSQQLIHCNSLYLPINLTKTITIKKRIRLDCKCPEPIFYFDCKAKSIGNGKLAINCGEFNKYIYENYIFTMKFKN